MNVRRRLILFGAVLPTVGSLVAVAAAGLLVRLSLQRALDRALLSQAAVESLSLFDGPSGEPHLPVPEAQMRERASLFAAAVVVAVYDSAGRPVIRFPEHLPVPDPLAVGVRFPAPTLRTVEPGAEGDGDREPRRELLLDVAARDGRRFVLWLGTSLAPLRSTMLTFYQVTFSLCAVVALALAALQIGQANRIARRVRVMAEHLPRLREGDYEAVLPGDPTGDELADLRSALAEATRRLGASRAAEERLIANAAHELRTPLGLMRTQIDLALRKQRDVSELREALAGTRGEVDRLAALAGQLLDLHSLGRGDEPRVEEDLVALVEDAVAAWATEAESRRITVVPLLPPAARLRCDPKAVRQAVDNLLANAVKFAPPGSEVRVELAPIPGGVRLVVTDAGPGIPAAERESVFEPFRRLPSGQPGTGLGLAIVRDVARRHRGRAYVVDAPGGAAIAVELLG